MQSFSPCKQFLRLEMKFVSELLVWNGVCACLLVELPFLDGISVGVEKVKGFFGIKAFIVFFFAFAGMAASAANTPDSVR